MTIYEMNKEQIIETAKKIADKVGCELLGLWTDLTHVTRRTIVYVNVDDWRPISRALYPVINGMETVSGEKLMTSEDRYSDGTYESCNLIVVNDKDRFEELLNICKGVNWVE